MATNYEPKVTVACVNYATRWGDKAANLDKMKRTARTAAKRGAEIIVFPELALSGYECDEAGAKSHKPCSMHEAAAETVPGPSTEEMASLAKEIDPYIIFGMPERDKTNPDIKYNAAAIVGPEGVMGTYHKLTLPPPPRYNESVCFRPGNEVPVWETRYGLVGIQICLDIYLYPEFSRIQAMKGARLICNVTATPSGPGQGEFLMQQASARATENLVYTASADLVGRDRTGSFIGYSCIAGPGNQRLANFLAKAGETEEIISATLDFRLTDYWRDSLKLWENYPARTVNDEYASIEKRGVGAK